MYKRQELDKYKKGELSLYGIIENAGKSSDKKGTEEALDISQPNGLLPLFLSVP